LGQILDKRYKETKKRGKKAIFEGPEAKEGNQEEKNKKPG